MGTDHSVCNAYNQSSPSQHDYEVIHWTNDRIEIEPSTLSQKAEIATTPHER